jgi:hypothetical protein
LNEAELEVDSEKASYKQKLEVLREQEELIEDEEEQEQKEEDARRAKKEADELEARTARSLLPESEVQSPSMLLACWNFDMLKFVFAVTTRGRSGGR